MPLILGTNSIKDTGYNVANSLRFDGSSSAYLSKTFGSSGNTKTFTISFWVKKCEFATGPDTMADAQMLLGGQQSSYPAFNLLFLHTDDRLFFKDAQASNDIQISIKTDFQFRDTSAWYHIVFAVDTTQSTASDRAKVYVNGVQQTELSGENASGGARDTPLYPDQNQDLQFNGNEAHYINKYATNYEDMYMAEYVFIDGSALAPTSFGEFDSDSPTIWKPKDVSDLTFGTNGFYLDFENASSLGADVSGNSNNWTSNNIATTDQSTDTCTNNFATMNVLDNQIQSATFSQGNLQVVTGASGYYSPSLSTIGVSQGKWYCEIELDTIGGSGSAVGVLAKQVTGQAIIGDDANGVAYLLYDGQSRTGGSSSSFGNTLANGDVVGIALDLDNNKVYFSKNGTFQASGDPAGNSNGLSVTAPASTETGFYFIGVQDVGNGTPGTTYKLNFGSPPYAISSGNSDSRGHGNFEYAVPSGFFALCTKNLAESG
jgi:hypothetical protein